MDNKTILENALLKIQENTLQKKLLETKKEERLAEINNLLGDKPFVSEVISSLGLSTDISAVLTQEITEENIHNLDVALREISRLVDERVEEIERVCSNI